MYSFFFFKQKTAYEMRISDWSSDVCSSDLIKLDLETELASEPDEENGHVVGDMEEIVGLQTDDELDGGDNMDSAYESSDGSGSDQDSEGGFDSDWMEIGRASCRERVCQYV